MHQLDEFVRVVIRFGPESSHVEEPSRSSPQVAVREWRKAWKLGRSTGFEPATSGTTNRRSNQLSYDRHKPGTHAAQTRC